MAEKQRNRGQQSGAQRQKSGHQGTGTIHGTVFNDANQEGVDGVPVTLLDSTKNKVVKQGLINPVGTTAGGNYQFPSLDLGSYWVEFPIDVIDASGIIR